MGKQEYFAKSSLTSGDRGRVSLSGLDIFDGLEAANQLPYACSLGLLEVVGLQLSLKVSGQISC
jgi:hypothetical protein